jgi:hypothetical protein
MSWILDGKEERDVYYGEMRGRDCIGTWCEADLIELRDILNHEFPKLEEESSSSLAEKAGIRWPNPRGYDPCTETCKNGKPCAAARDHLGPHVDSLVQDEVRKIWKCSQFPNDEPTNKPRHGTMCCYWGDKREVSPHIKLNIQQVLEIADSDVLRVWYIEEYDHWRAEAGEYRSEGYSPDDAIYNLRTEAINRVKTRHDRDAAMLRRIESNVDDRHSTPSISSEHKQLIYLNLLSQSYCILMR